MLIYLISREMNTVKSTRLLSKGKVSLKKTKQGLVVTSSGNDSNSGIYYVFNVSENTSYVVTLTGKKLDSSATVCLAIWSGTKSPLSCKRVFTVTSNTYGHMIPHRKGKQLCIGVLFQSAKPGDSFLLSNLTLMSRNRRKTVKFNTLKKEKKKARSTSRSTSKAKAPPTQNIKRRQTVPDITNLKSVAKKRNTTLSGPIDLEKIRQIATRDLSSSRSLQKDEKDAITHLTQQLEKLSRLKSDMEENFSKMFDDQRSRIKRLEEERKNMKGKLATEYSNGIQKEHKNNPDEYFGSMSASMDMFPSIGMDDSVESIPPLEFRAIPLRSPANSLANSSANSPVNSNPDE